MDSAHLLYTDSRLNPCSTQPSQYWDPADEDTTLYVMQREGSKGYKVFTSYGHLNGWEIGTSHHVHADQSGRYMGVHTVVGIVTTHVGKQGLVPNRLLHHSVFK